ncbi:MAG: M48 family metallopeptidase [Pseudomonadota bacterium]
MNTTFLKLRPHYAAYAVLAVSALLAGCATKSIAPNVPATSSPATEPFIQIDTPEQVALKARIALQDRLYRVAAPLLVNNTELCRNNARKLLGFTAKNKYSYGTEFLDAAERSFGLGERLRILAVLSGGSAAQAGLKPGDILLNVEDKAMPQGPNAERVAAALLGPMVNSRSTVRITLQRGSETIPINVALTPACAYNIELGNADNVNAYSDGARVMVTRGMMNFARSDAELAYVIAREMAHAALGHPGRLRMSATLGGIIDNLIRIRPDLSVIGGTSGVKPFTQDVDAAADTLSLYLLARAGYEIDSAPRFWQRLATQYPATVLNGYTAIHPSTGYRLSVMEQIITDVKAKKSSNQKLIP